MMVRLLLVATDRKTKTSKNMHEGDEEIELQQYQGQENLEERNEHIELADDVNALLNIENQLNTIQEPSGLGFEFPLSTEDTDNVEITVNLEETFGGRLLDDDLLSFIGVHFSDEHNLTELRPYKALNTKPETNRSGEYLTISISSYSQSLKYFFLGIFVFVGMRIVWFENALTGELVPIAKRMAASSSNDAANKKKNSDTMSDGDADGADSVIVDIDGENSDGLTGQKYNTTDEDDEESSYLLSAIPSPIPLISSGPSGLDDKNGQDRKSEKSGIFSMVGSKGKDKLPFDEAAKITAYNNLVTTQRGFFMFFQVRNLLFSNISDLHM